MRTKCPECGLSFGHVEGCSHVLDGLKRTALLNGKSVSLDKDRPYEWHGMLMPMHLQESLMCYAQDGRPTGDFLRACLANDLTGATFRADDINEHLLPVITAYIVNHIPAKIRGSETRIDAWIQEKADERRRKDDLK